MSDTVITQLQQCATNYCMVSKLIATNQNSPTFTNLVDTRTKLISAMISLHYFRKNHLREQILDIRIPGSVVLAPRMFDGCYDYAVIVHHESLYNNSTRKDEDESKICTDGEAVTMCDDILFFNWLRPRNSYELFSQSPSKVLLGDVRLLLDSEEEQLREFRKTVVVNTPCWFFSIDSGSKDRHY